MEKVLYKTRTFVDFENKPHIVTVCLIQNNWFLLGYSVCHPDEEYDEQKGKNIAHKRAESFDGNWISVGHKGMFMENADAILEMYLNYLLDNPGIMIGGYNARLKKFKEDVKYANILNSFTDEQLKTMTLLAKTSEEEFKLAKRLAKYVI